MLPVLTVAVEGETRVPIAAKLIADRLGLSEQDREERLPSGTQRILHNRIHWAKFYLGKAGLIESPRRGVFVATLAGKAALERWPDRIDVEVLKNFPAFVEFYSAAANSGTASEGRATSASAASTTTPEEQIDAAHSVLNSALKADLLSRALDQSPAFFERLIVELLVAMGYGGSHEKGPIYLTSQLYPPITRLVTRVGMLTPA